MIREVDPLSSCESGFPRSTTVWGFGQELSLSCKLPILDGRIIISELRMLKTEIERS